MCTLIGRKWEWITSTVMLVFQDLSTQEGTATLQDTLPILGSIMGFFN